MLKYGKLRQYASRIFDPPRIYLVLFVVENDDARFELDVLIIKLGLIIERDLFFLLVDLRVVLCLVMDLAFEQRLFGLGGIRFHSACELGGIV